MPLIDCGDWIGRAACRGRQQMVPDDEQLETQLAKLTCRQCPVVSRCLTHAEQIGAQFGRAQTQGIWAGLTQQERDTMAALGWLPRPCAKCTLDFVPINSETPECKACDPKQTLHYPDYRERITALIDQGLSPSEISETLRIRQQAVTTCIRRWELKPLKKSQAGKRSVQECGTLAAKTRHRKKGESEENCACKHVRWKKGNRRLTTKGGQ